MAQKISKKEEILARLAKEGKVTLLNRPADQIRDAEMNKSMTEMRRKYLVMERESHISSSKVILTS